MATDVELGWLANAAYGNVLAVEEKEYMGPWTQLPDGEFQRSFLQHHWGVLAAWKLEDWTLGLSVFPRGAELPVGVMAIGAKDFALAKSVSTGSWLLREWQGRGLGKQMRTAVLHLAFHGLGATEARSSASLLNQSSRGVSRALGYHEDGNTYNVLHGHRVEEVRLCCLRQDFQPVCEVEVEGDRKSVV